MPPAYETAADLGFKEFELRNYPEARERFLQAEHLYPNARIARALGMVEYELRHYQAASEHLERALTRTERPLSSEERAETEQLLRSARGYLARFEITVFPDSARLRLDGTPLQLAADGVLVLQVGDHVLEAEREQYWPTRRELHVRGGDDQRVELRLLPQAPVDQPKPLYASPWLWVGTGVVAAGVAVALLVALAPAQETKVGQPTTTANSPPGVVITALGGP